MDAVLYGYQPLEIGWQRVGSLLVPGTVVGKPPEWFCFDPDNQLRLKTRANPNQGELLPARKFLLPRQDYFIAVCVIAALLIVRHKQNIIGLLSGKESRIGQKTDPKQDE